MITNNDMLLAFGLTLIAGLSTGIGSLIALLSKKTDTRFLSASIRTSAQRNIQRTRSFGIYASGLFHRYRAYSTYRLSGS